MVAAADLAPDCVTLEETLVGAKVHNGCSSTERVKVFRRFFFDTTCTVLAPGDDFSFVAPFGVDRIESC